MEVEPQQEQQQQQQQQPSTAGLGSGLDDALHDGKHQQQQQESSRRGRRPGRRSGDKADIKAKLERSRQSARECRARKKLRYQYLEELVSDREKAVFALRNELEVYRAWCQQLDSGVMPDGLQAALEEFGDVKREKPGN